MFWSRKKALVVDTSVFVNPKTRSLLGRTPLAAVKKFMLMAGKCYRVFMPRSAYKELRFFVGRDFFVDGLVVREPSFSVSVPSRFLRDLVEEYRKRTVKGLRVAEEFAKRNDDPRVLIKELRSKYREAVRKGVIDSYEDVDVLVLALEEKGIVLSCDEGLLLWADKLGLPWYEPREFVASLKRCK